MRFLLDCKQRNLSPRSIKYYENSLQHLQKAFAEQKLTLNLQSVTTCDLQKYFVAFMINKKLAPRTINGRIASCKSFFGFLLRNQYVKSNVAENLQCVKAPKDTIATFTNDELLRLLQQPNQTTFTGLRDYTIMILLLETGIRISELLSLSTHDVNMRERELRIQSGKGDKSRVVPFQKTCAKVLQTYLTERGNPPTDVLFVSLENGPLHKRTLQDRMHDYGLMAKLTGVRVSPHTFRHTMAKLYIRNGGDPFSLQQILGHSSLDMVQMYVRLFSTEVKEQHRKYSPVEHIQSRRKRL